MNQVLLIPDWKGGEDSNWMRQWAETTPLWKVLDIESFVQSDEEFWIAAILHTLQVMPEPRHVVAEGVGCLAALAALNHVEAVPVDSLFFVSPIPQDDENFPTRDIKGFRDVSLNPPTCESVLVTTRDSSQTLQEWTQTLAKRWGAVSIMITEKKTDPSWQEGYILFVNFCLRMDSCHEV